MTNSLEDASFRLASELFNARNDDNWGNLIDAEMDAAGIELDEPNPAYALMTMTLYNLLAGVNVTVDADAIYPFRKKHLRVVA